MEAVEKSYNYQGIEYIVKQREHDFGAASYAFSDQYFYIMNIYVKPECRGKGYGKELLKELLDLAKDYNSDVYLLVEYVHEEGIEHGKLVDWYKRNGFVPAMDRGDLPFNYNMLRRRNSY